MYAKKTRWTCQWRVGLKQIFIIQKQITRELFFLKEYFRKKSKESPDAMIKTKGCTTGIREKKLIKKGLLFVFSISRNRYVVFLRNQILRMPGRKLP